MNIPAKIEILKMAIDMAGSGKADPGHVLGIAQILNGWVDGHWDGDAKVEPPPLEGFAEMVGKQLAETRKL